MDGLFAWGRRPRTAPDADEICVAFARQIFHFGIAFQRLVPAQIATMSRPSIIG